MRWPAPRQCELGALPLINGLQVIVHNGHELPHSLVPKRRRYDVESDTELGPRLRWLSSRYACQGVTKKLPVNLPCTTARYEVYIEAWAPLHVSGVGHPPCVNRISLDISEFVDRKMYAQ